MAQWQARATWHGGREMTFGVQAPHADAAWDIAAEQLPAELAPSANLEVTEITPRCALHRVRHECTADRDRH